MAIRCATDNDFLERSSGLPSVTAFTMMGWFYNTAFAVAGGTFLAYGGTGGLYYALFHLGSTNKLSIWNSVSFPDTGTVMTTDTWKHLAMVVDHTGTATAYGYLNGVQDVTVESDTDILTTSMRVGADHDPKGPGDHRHAAIKVWDAVLTADEIKMEMWTNAPRRTANLYSWTPGFVHTDVSDYSGNGNGWTANGTLSTQDGPPIPYSEGSRRIFLAGGPLPPPPGTSYVLRRMRFA